MPENKFLESNILHFKDLFPLDILRLIEEFARETRVPYELKRELRSEIVKRYGFKKLYFIGYRDFSHIDLIGTYIKDVCLWKCNFENSNFAHTTFSGTELTECNFKDTILSDIYFRNCTLMSSKFIDSNMYHSNIRNCHAYNAVFVSCNINKATIKNSMFQNAIITNSRLKYTIFSGCDIRGVEFFGCNTKDALFTNVNKF